MSTLEGCADALLQQKVVQASNYERLEARLMEMERTKRSLFFGLKEVITDVERRTQDLSELKQENSRLRQQLQQGNVKFGALAVFIKDEQKKTARLRETLEGCEIAWAGYPARVALVLHALQERQVFREQLGDVVKNLERVNQLVIVLRRVGEVHSRVAQRLVEHSAETVRLDDAYKQERQLTAGLREEYEQHSVATLAESDRLRGVAQRLELQQLVRESELAAARVESSEAEARNDICRMALQGALTAADTQAVKHQRAEVYFRFVSWRCGLLHTVVSAAEAQTEVVSEMMNTWVGGLRCQRDRLKEETAQTESGRALSAEELEVARTSEAIFQRRNASLRLLCGALRLLYCRQRSRAADIHKEWSQLEGEVSRARKAHEARLFARRLLLLQKEAREGLCAEELLTRRALAEGEEAARQEAVTQRQLDLEAVKKQKLQRDVSPLRREEKADATRSWFQLTNPAKLVVPRARGAAETEKKRPRLPPDVATPARRTYPLGAKPKSAESDKHWEGGNETPSLSHPQSPPSSPPRNHHSVALIRPSSQVKATRCSRSPSLSGMPVSTVHNSNSSKKRGQPRKNFVTKLGPVGHLVTSPLPRRPSAAKPIDDVVAGAGVQKGVSHHGPRPSLLSEKEPWNGAKFEDVFSDIFPY
ncbi:hypothetical protein, conserved [Trypanosoma brucei gambiense DAL972]|uniref:Uncharacterized protein n=1 Tax=Trypanosoma brucei gambiense (strain MHOM/CI/86/DAL972) TaxID=679716 RepID=C9ZSU4_TRYB9|nr:hypothetical protein, conserved [Trypanosoma brucei gambiense DAL972]CBH12479.1 hypothetical protein, conserved [Trypanosoma brucei gambiense DAL972]|eukprot:XP_011774759.1 hypothetical protein, conserved [Trypanosoma brucei gambiense DAL972]